VATAAALVMLRAMSSALLIVTGSSSSAQQPSATAQCSNSLDYSGKEWIEASYGYTCATIVRENMCGQEEKYSGLKSADGRALDEACCNPCCRSFEGRPHAYARRTACQCPPNHFLNTYDGGKCVHCPAGRYADAGFSSQCLSAHEL
jgi:hypothetical protein